MQHIPIVVFQSREQDQWETNDNCFSEENRISLVQVSQTPVAIISIHPRLNPQIRYIGEINPHKSIKYLQYRYDYDSQTSSVFAHNCKE